jgi:preprotein translocase subunit SecB
MSDAGAGDGASQGAGAAPQAQAAPPQIQILAQYVKDLSFENPNAPQSLTAASEAPRIEVSVDVGARGMGQERFEIELRITAKAHRGETRAFVAEVLYAGLFALRNIPQEALQLVCLIECPRLIFPFARRILADATRDGGFPPLLLEPIDFAALYRQQEARAQAQAAQAPAQQV